MPLKEYRCRACRRRFTLLVGMVAAAPELRCPGCGGAEAIPLISRFAVGRSEDDLLDDLADPGAAGDPDDPRAMADYMKRIGRELGEDLDDDFDELVEEAVHEELDDGGEDFGGDEF